jgi:hypothetical protein
MEPAINVIKLLLGVVGSEAVQFTGNARDIVHTAQIIATAEKFVHDVENAEQIPVIEPEEAE